MPRVLPAVRSVDNLSTEERTRLCGVADLVATEGDRFVRQYGLSNVLLRRTWPVGVMMSAGFCDLPPPSISLISRLVLWIFALDDEMDESGQSLEVSSLLLGQCAEATLGAANTAQNHPLVHSLAQLRLEFSTRPSWATMQHPWQESLCQMYRAMQMEHYWQLGYSCLGEDALPSYSQYMNWGWRSIGVWPMLQSMFALAQQDSLPAPQAERDRLVYQSATAIRLANDLRSDEKEAGEGGVNSLVILKKEHDLGAKSVEPIVFQTMRGAVAELGGLSQSLPRGGPNPVVDAIRRVTRLLCEFYASSDFHWTADQQITPQWQLTESRRPGTPTENVLEAKASRLDDSHSPLR